MATKDVLSAPVTAFPESEKLQRKVNVFREVIESEKMIVRRIGREMREVISRKEEEVIRELDAIWDSVSVGIERKKQEIQNKIREIEKRDQEIREKYEEMKSLFQDINEPFALPAFANVSNGINSLKQKMDISIPYVKVTLRLDELKESMKIMFSCEQRSKEDISYKLKWCKGEKYQLHSPHGIAISSLNNNIYVTDRHYNPDRIQIFSKEGELIRTFKHNELIKPENILFLTESIYVQCEERIVQFNESSEKIEKWKSYAFPLRGICTDKSSIFVGNHRGMKLIKLTADLTEEKQITLNTELCKQGATEIRDISLSAEEIYVLLSGTEYPIQSFSEEGTLTRCVIGKDSIGDAYHFCLDQQLNLIVSDRGEKCVKIFSNEGNLLTKLHRQQGQFTNLSGIAVDKLGCVLAAENYSSWVFNPVFPTLHKFF